MPTQLTTDDFKQSLNGHVAAKGEEIYAKYGSTQWQKVGEYPVPRTLIEK